MENNNYIDFILNINEDREIRVLQITDLQPVDISKQRYEGRLNNVPFNSVFTDEMKYNNEFYYIEKSIKDNNPDLILLTGDNIYGEFDDDGENLIELINYMDSFKIPWALIFGNHDNESKMGVKWQTEQILKAKYGMFKRRELTGNGNYTIGIYKMGKLIRVFYMVDSNGCYNARSYNYIDNYPLYNLDERIERNGGIFFDQIEWIQKNSNMIDKSVGRSIKKTICAHICPDFVDKQAVINGYQKNDLKWNNELYSLNNNPIAKNGDFGEKGEYFSSFYSANLLDILIEGNFDTMFIGHCHNNNISIDCSGVRVTFGVKTSTFDYYTKVGSTLFTILDKDKYKIEHKFIDPLK